MSATKSTTLYDAKLTPVITETPDSVSIGKVVLSSISDVPTNFI